MALMSSRNAWLGAISPVPARSSGEPARGGRAREVVGLARGVVAEGGDHRLLVPRADHAPDLGNASAKPWNGPDGGLKP